MLHEVQFSRGMMQGGFLFAKRAIRHIQRAKERDENGVVNNDVACLMFFLNVDIGYIYAVGRNPMLPV